MGKIQSLKPPPLKLLSELPLGVPARVTDIHTSGFESRRLLEYGLTPGTPVVALFRSPGGNLTAFEIRGAVIALRREDAKNSTYLAAWKQVFKNVIATHRLSPGSPRTAHPGRKTTPLRGCGPAFPREAGEDNSLFSTPATRQSPQILNDKFQASNAYAMRQRRVVQAFGFCRLDIGICFGFRISCSRM